MVYNKKFGVVCILAFLIMLSVVLQANSTNRASKKQTVPVNLRCEYLVNPIGIDNIHPGLSWQTNTTLNNWLQSAYQIIVATSPELLTEQKCNVWNSGKVSNGESVCIPYSGPAIKSQKRYYWAVRVWDQKGNTSAWSKSAFWEIGILNNKDWSAKWISNIDKEERADREDIRWVWLPDQNATDVPSKTKASFRINVNIDQLPQIATMNTVARGEYQLFVNGKLIDSKKKAWQAFERQDILANLKTGENIIEVQVNAVRSSSFIPGTNKPLSGNYAAFAALLKIEDKNGTIRRYPTSTKDWLCRNAKEDNWKQAKVVGELNDPKFGWDPGPLSQPASMFRKEFKLNKAVESARLYVSALGSYRMFINGSRVGKFILTPEFTNYNSRITYQTYDVTALLNNGSNAVGSILGDGWYGSPLGWNGEYDVFGTSPNELMAEIHITYKDGTREKILTDGSWKAYRSPVLKSEIYSGEFYDARLEQTGWNKPGFDDKSWKSATTMAVHSDLLSSQVNQPVEVRQIVKPVSIEKAGNQRWIIDMGQNLVGWARLKVKGNAGTIIKLRYAERLATKDSLYTDNLRGATATDCYVLNGKGEEVFTPHFTFHGFRYIEVTGYPGLLTKEVIVAEVINSLENLTGYIQTSNPLLNKMYSLGIWGQRGNFISVPTDCPQRDERLGYTGDGQVFWRTGTYNFDIAAFTHKWMRDVRDEQTVAGSFTNTAPAVPKSNRKNGSPGWEDAGVIVPWCSWLQYGDKSIIHENWPAMVRYMDYVAGQSKNFIRPGGYLGDWLAPDTNTPNDLIGTALWAMTANMMSQMAVAIGKENDARNYSVLKEKIKEAFQKEYIAADGKVGTGTQTCYVMALHAGLVPDSLKKQVADKLVKAIEDRNWHLSTGFLGTPYLLFALSENDRADVAYRLLLNDTYPSWGYMIKNGATTWWERWDSDKGDPSMNSYNHYAFGSVVEWIYRSIAGINTDPKAPGFKKIIISPTFDKSGKITQTKGELTTVYGIITSEWKLTSANTVELRINIPANTTAELVLPTNTTLSKVIEGELFAGKSEKQEMGSGQHVFEIKW